MKKNACSAARHNPAAPCERSKHREACKAASNAAARKPPATKQCKQWIAGSHRSSHIARATSSNVRETKKRPIVVRGAAIAVTERRRIRLRRGGAGGKFRVRRSSRRRTSSPRPTFLVHFSSIVRRLGCEQRRRRRKQKIVALAAFVFVVSTASATVPPDLPRDGGLPRVHRPRPE